MYCRLPWNHAITPLSNPELVGRTEYNVPQRYGKAMKNVTPNPTVNHAVIGAARDYALSLLPKKLLSLEVPTVLHLDMNAVDAPNPSLTAHKDYNRRCAINAYSSANGEITHYYSWNNKEETLSEVGNFIAKQGEWWLLDTSVLHSVSLIPKKRRVIFSISFSKTPYETVKTILEGECNE